LKNGKNQTYTPSAQYGTGENAVKVYKITVSKLDSGTLDLTVSNKNGNKTISLPLGGKAITTSAQAISVGVEVFYGNTSVQGEKLIISFNSSEANKTQRFTMSGNYVSTINERTDWLTIRAKGASGVKYSVCFEYEVMSSYYEVASGYFTGAIDSINVKNIHSLSWNSGKIKKIHVYIGEKGDGARSVEIYDMTVAVLG
ncbi:MAG: hypothetical protein IJ800_06835, partial [Clostridia bacterium]|nr:hypothetical protein [Clostridia bacterium]